MSFYVVVHDVVLNANGNLCKFSMFSFVFVVKIVVAMWSKLFAGKGVWLAIW